MGPLEKSLRSSSGHGVSRRDLDLMAEVIAPIETRAEWTPGMTTGPRYSWDPEDVQSFMTASFYEKSGNHRRLTMQIHADGTYNLNIV